MPTLPAIEEVPGVEESQVQRFEPSKEWLTGTPLQALAPALDKWFFDNLERVYAPVRNARGDFFVRLLESLDLRYECSPADLKRIPAHGPVIIVVNHPMGLADGVIMGALLESVRPDIRFMANSLLMAVPQLRNYVIPVDPFGGASANRFNRHGLRQSIEWLRNGGQGRVVQSACIGVAGAQRNNPVVIAPDDQRRGANSAEQMRQCL